MLSQTLARKLNTALLNSLGADMLRFYGEELNYSDLLVGFALIGLATWMSENLVEKIAGDLNILDAFDEAKKGRK